MKTKFKRIGRQSVSVILAVMMMLSTMLVGMVSTSAATTTWYVIGHDYDTNWSTNGKSCQMSYDTTTGFYYIDKTLLSLEGNHYFRLHDGSNQYGPQSTSENETINSFGTSSSNNHTVSQNNSTAFKYACTSLNYRLWFDETNKRIWITDNNAQPTTYNVTVNYTDGQVSSIKYNDQPVSNGESIPVNSGASFELSVTAAPGYSVNSVTTQDGTELTESNGTYTLSSVTKDTTITVNTTSSSSGGEGTATGYKLLVGKTEGDVGNYNKGSTSTSTKIFDVYQLTDGTYYATVPANIFTKDNNFFALSSNGYSDRILSYTNSSFDSSLSSDVNWIQKQGYGVKEFVIVNFNKDIDYDVKITYKAGVYTISRAAAPVTTHEVKLTQESSLNATVKVTSGTTTTTLNSTTVANVAENSTYTLSVKPASGYRITGIYVGGSLISEPITNPYIENSFTKSMGTANVDVRVTTDVAPSYDITTTDYDKTQGIVVVSPTSCKVGETFTVTVTTNTNYAVDTVVAKYGENTLEAIQSGNVYTYTMPASDVTVTVTFKKSQGTESTKYYLMHSTSNNLWENSNTVKSDLTCYQDGDNYSITIDKSALGSSNYFAFTTSNSNTDSKNHMVERNATSEPTVESDSTIFSDTNINNHNADAKYYFIYTGFKDLDSVKSVTVTYNPTTHNYTLSADVLTDIVYLYAAKGNQADGGNKFADSVSYVDGISEGYTKETSDGIYKVFRAHKGDKVTIKYTMQSGYAKAGYYIYALVVDGKKVEVTRADDLVYVSAPITLTNEKTEVTPVYYNSVIEGAGDYITVYATAPQAITEKWGNTLAIYTWFNTSGSKTGDGSYPGQPMMQEGDGKYVAKVAKYYYSYDSTNNKVVKEDTLIKGLLLNNFAENQNSRKSHFLTNDDQKKNNQTYDYDDFVKIAAMGYDTVQFDIKYDPKKPESNQSKVVGTETNAPDKSSSDKAPDLITTTFTEPYEPLKNIDGKDVSILGYDDATIQSMDNRLTGLNRDQSIKIISVGNQNIYVNGDTWNTEKFDGATQNKWSTIWYVYGTDGKFVTRGLPSDFIPRGTYNNVTGKFTESETQTAAYKAIKEKGLQYTSAKISYETRMNAATSVDNGNGDPNQMNTGVRVDGRWYYARSAEKANVEVGIIYKNGDTYTPDTTTNDDLTKNPFVGKTTRATASISYSDSNGDHSQIANASVNRNTKVTFTADNSTTYKFIGWSNTETPTPDQIINDGDYALTVGSATKLYAVYEPYASGILSLNHSKYNGPGANGGVGTYYIKAEVVDPTDNHVVKEYGGNPTDSSVEIEKTYINESSTYKIKVTLYTKPSANSTFESFYGYEGNDFTTVVGSTTKTDSNGLFVSKTYEIDPTTLFSSGTQTVMNVNYYTDLKLPVLASEIVFNYQPYKNAPNPAPQPGKGTGTTNFTLTITKEGESSTPAFEITKPVSSLTLSATGNIYRIVDDYAQHNNDYTITITMKPVADSHCYVGQTYLQGNEYTEVTDTDTAEDTITVTRKLSELYNKTDGKFNYSTVNYYTDFTADEYTFNATFKYNGYDSRKYFDQNGYGNNVSDIPKDKADEKTFTVNQTITGADIDNYLTQDEKGDYKLTDQFLIDYAPYEDNFVQTITWDLANATVSFANSTVTATITATYKTEKFTVTVEYPENHPDHSAAKTHTVDYAELVTDSDTKEFFIKASDSYVDNGTIKYFNYWLITNDHNQEVAKCFNTEFNYRVYDNYIVTAVYGDKSASVRPDDERYTTIQFLEYSRNKYDVNRKTEDKVYADFAIAYYYDRLQLKNDNNQNLEVGVVFAFDKAQNSDNNSWTGTAVSKETVKDYIKDTPIADANLKFVINRNLKGSLDNKNRVEFSWRVDNLPANQPLNLVAYSYIYDKKTGNVIISDGQNFKFHEVGNQTYKITTNNS